MSLLLPDDDSIGPSASVSLSGPAEPTLRRVLSILAIALAVLEEAVSTRVSCLMLWRNAMALPCRAPLCGKPSTRISPSGRLSLALRVTTGVFEPCLLGRQLSRNDERRHTNL